jgi:hypothetical protein
MVPAGESEYPGLLKTHKLLISRDAQKSKNAEIAPNWNVSGTRDFQFSCKFCKVFLERKKISNRANRFEQPNSLCRTPVSVRLSENVNCWVMLGAYRLNPSLRGAC